MSIIEGTISNFEKEVLKSKEMVLVDFNADWCGPCRMLAPILEKLSENNDSIKIVSVNIDNEEDLATKYNVFSIPCLVIFQNGVEKKRNVGFIPEEELESFIGE